MTRLGWVRAVVVTLLVLLVAATVGLMAAAGADGMPSPAPTAPASGVRDGGPVPSAPKETAAPAPAQAPAAAPTTAAATRNPVVPLRDGMPAPGDPATANPNPMLKDARQFPVPPQSSGVPLQDGAAPTPLGAPNPPTSTAPPGGGGLDTICRSAPPMEVPGESWLDVIDFGEARGDGLYARYGYAGWKSHLYNPGCDEKIIGALAEKIGGTVGLAGDSVTQDGGPNRAVNLMLSGTLLLIAVTVAGTRLAFGDYPLWDVATQVSEAGRVVYGQPVLIGFVTLGVLATVGWLAVKYRESMAWTMTALWRAAAVLFIGLVVIGWGAAIGTQYDDMVNGANRAATAVVAGEENPGLSVGDVTGEALIRHVYLPMWGMVHLGNDSEAVGLYAERLHAAGAATVDESERIAGSQAEYDKLAEAKSDDYDTVAAEVLANKPSSYRQLEGGDAAARVGFAFLLMLTVTAIALVLAFTAVLVVAARLIVRVTVFAYPLIVAALQFPLLQRWGLGIPAFALRWAVTGVAASVVSVVIHRVLIVGVITEGAGSVLQRVVVVAAINAVLIAGWLNRGRLAARLGVESQMDQAARAMHRAADRIERVTEEPRKKTVARVNAFRYGTPRRPDVDAGDGAASDRRVRAGADGASSEVGSPAPLRRWAQTEERDAKRNRSRRRRASAATTTAAVAARVAPPQVRPAAKAAAVVAARRERQRAKTPPARRRNSDRVAYASKEG